MSRWKIRSTAGVAAARVNPLYHSAEPSGATAAAAASEAGTAATATMSIVPSAEVAAAGTRTRRGCLSDAAATEAAH